MVSAPLDILRVVGAEFVVPPFKEYQCSPGSRKQLADKGEFEGTS